jgi:uncharacterized protein with HEPN domain
MARKVRPVLSEILDAIDGIRQATDGKSFADFQADWLPRRAVQRAIEIISEASKHIPDRCKQAQPQIPWPTVAGIGNVLRHEYHKIADEVVWAVVIDDLPPLRIAIEAIRAGLSTE